jgi:hypothetical protein
VLSATAASVGGGAGGGPGAGAFNIEVRFIGTAPSGAIQSAFGVAASRIASVITGDVSSVNLTNFDYATECDLPGAPVLNETIDDLVIFVSVGPIDGVSGTLGSAGPCFVRLPSYLPFVGDMTLDVADLEALNISGRLVDVITHEMLHIVGIGTIWGNGALAKVSGQGGPDPFFTGAGARAQYIVAGGNPLLSGVPVENTGGAGTRDGHWRESIFGRELMTGFLNNGAVNPLSAITVAALGDLGYTVSLDNAEGYTVSASLRSAMVESSAALHTSGRAVRGGVGLRGARTILRVRRD